MRDDKKILNRKLMLDGWDEVKVRELIDVERTIERLKKLHGNRDVNKPFYSLSDIIDMLQSQPAVEE